ncbi:MAG: hypothetical protein HKO72_09320 [Flavobacteriaceae bacterium]|nr:hypothetical protein [Bacteroidia bacterium]NNL61517.1 hypothetical protein [Flavobacteriaceae bacterium]
MVLQSTTKRLAIWALVIVALLMIPLVAMQFTNEVNWDVSDFAIMGSVLIAIAMIYELVARRSEQTVYRIAMGIGLLGAFLLFWVNGAVGIIGNEGQPANYLYALTFVVIMGGSVLSGFTARGLAYTLFTAAAVQMLVPVIALIIWPPPDTSWSPSIFGVFLLTSFFAWLFLVSGLLFRKANS